MQYIKKLLYYTLFVISFFVLIFFLSDILLKDYCLFFDEWQFKQFNFYLETSSYLNLEEFFNNLYETNKNSGIFFFNTTGSSFGYLIADLYLQNAFILPLASFIKYKILCFFFITLQENFFIYYNAFEILRLEQYIYNCFFIKYIFKLFICIFDLNTWGCDLLKCKLQLLYTITKEAHSPLNFFSIEWLNNDYVHDSSFGPCSDEDLEFNLPNIGSFRSSLYSYFDFEHHNYAYVPYFEEYFFLADRKETYGIHSTQFLFKYCLLLSSFIRVETVNAMGLLLKTIGDYNIFNYQILYMDWNKYGSYFLDYIIYFHQKPLIYLDCFFKYKNPFFDLDYYYFLSLYDQWTKVTDDWSLAAWNIIFSSYPEIKEDFFNLDNFIIKCYFLENNTLDIYQILYEDLSFYFIFLLFVIFIMIYLIIFFSQTLYVIYNIYFFKNKGDDFIKYNVINRVQRYYFVKYYTTFLFYLINFIEKIFYNIYCPHILIKTIYISIQYIWTKFHQFIEYQMSGILQISGILPLNKVKISNMQQILINQIKLLDKNYPDDLINSYVETIFNFNYKENSIDMLCPLVLRRLDKVRLKYETQKKRLQNDLKKLA